MKLIQIAVIAALAAQGSFARAQGNDVCVEAFEAAHEAKVVVTDQRPNRVVSGPGRLYFHTAPDERCRMKNVFVVPNDRLEVFADHDGYTEVIYWNPATGSGTAGWVPSARLAEIREMIGFAAPRRDTDAR
jgi:hypothetical protein